MTFSATISPTQSFSFTGINDEYTFSGSGAVAINITLEDDAKNATLFTRLGSNETWDACLVEINGVNYTAHPTEGITEGTPDVLKLPNDTVITIQSGQTILITVAADKIVDRFTDASFFDTNVTNAAASGFVSSVNDATGAIEEIQISIGGAGYRKRPSTARLLPDASATSINVIPTDSRSLTYSSILANTNIAFPSLPFLN